MNLLLQKRRPNLEAYHPMFQSTTPPMMSRRWNPNFLSSEANGRSLWHGQVCIADSKTRRQHSSNQSSPTMNDVNHPVSIPVGRPIKRPGSVVSGAGAPSHTDLTDVAATTQPRLARARLGSTPSLSSPPPALRLQPDRTPTPVHVDA